MLKRLLAILLCFVAASAGVRPAIAGDHEQFNPPKQYYLALGDSLAFGFSFTKFLATYPAPALSANVFDTGYVDDFAAALQTIRPGIQVVNLSCPGETSASYLQGGCPYTASPNFLPLHTAYTGAQRDAALAFLKAHPGEVSPITFDLGINDVLPIPENLCPTFDPVCVGQHLPPILETLAANLDRTFAELRKAAPNAEIIVVQYYNPFAPFDPTSDVFAIELNQVISSVASHYGIRLADVFTPFNRTGNETVTVCTLAYICAGPTLLGPDIHPTDAGYGVIANQFWNASDYTRLLGGSH